MTDRQRSVAEDLATDHIECDWIESGEREWPFSYENICEVLGLNPEYIRRGLSKWRQQKSPVKRTAARIVPLVERRAAESEEATSQELQQAS